MTEKSGKTRGERSSAFELFSFELTDLVKRAASFPSLISKILVILSEAKDPPELVGVISK